MPHPTRRLALLGAATLLIAGCATAPAPDAATVIRQSEAAMGGAGLRTIAFAGSGRGNTFGQAFGPAQPWPALNYSSLSRVADYEAGAFREDFARSRAEPNGGGAVPLMGQGEQRAAGFARDRFAWNTAGNAATAAPVARDQRIHDLWTTPHGVLKAAAKHGATAARRSVDGVEYTTLSFTVPGSLKATAFIGASGLVERVESALPHPVMGDTAVVTRYLDYRDVGGVKFPGRMVQSQGGAPVFDVTINDVKPNVATGFEVPANVLGFAERVAVEPVARGVWMLGGGSHNSVAIEMKDEVIVVEAPLYDGRSGAVLAEARKLVPGKPVRTVINSHHHFDHAGGLRTAVAEGATLVTSAMAKPWFEKAFETPNSISPDALAKSGRRASIIGVDGRHVIDDGSRRVEVHEMQGSVHAVGFMLVWLPAERLLIQADAYTPAPPNTPPPATPNGNNVNLAQNIERLKLNVDRILPLHGRVVPVGELYAAIGRKP